MIPSNDFSVILACTHSRNWNSTLLCEFPEACEGCIFNETHGSHNVKKALKAYHAYEEEISFLGL